MRIDREHRTGIADRLPWAVAALALTLACGAYASEDLSIPEDLSGYRFVHAFAITDPEDPLFGFHHFYVNETGLDGLRSGGPYPEGAAFVALVFGVAQDGASINEGDGAAVALMKKVAGAEDTGGWRFAMFKPDGERLAIDERKDCFECHTQVKDRDYVFSQPLSIGRLGSPNAAADADKGDVQASLFQARARPAH
jgi:hypothetical protein